MRDESQRPSNLLAACAIGLFFVWFETLFPMGMGVDGPDLSNRPGFFKDLGWLASILGAFLGCMMLGFYARLNKEAFTAKRLKERCLTTGFVGAVAMSAGSVPIVFGAAACWVPIAGGALTGLGAALLGASWLPGAAHLSDGSAHRTIALSVVASTGISALLGAFSHAASLLFLAISPICAQGFATAAMWDASQEAGSRAPFKDSPGDGPAIERAPLFNLQSTVTTVCFFTVFFVLSFIESHVDLTLTTGTFWLVNASGLINLVLLILLARLLDAARLEFVLAILAATSVAAMPVSIFMAGDGACFVFVKVATFFAYALSLLYIAGTMRPGRGLADSWSRALMFLGMIVGTILAGTLIGNAVHAVFGEDALSAALVSVALLWGILIVIAVAAMNRRIRVEHIISGSFDDISDIARTRCGIISQQHPDLSERERDVLELVLLGYSTPRIAQRLVVSENTVKTHLRHIYAKLGVGSRQELMAKAEETPVGAKRERRQHC